MASRSVGKKMLMFLVVIIAFQDVAAGVAGSIMADIIKAFPEYDPTIVMLVATFPGLLQIIPALLYGKLTQHFNKRTLLFTGLILFMVGGTMPMFFADNLPLIIAMRGLLGLGVGITMPLSVDVITDFFEGREKDFLIGFGTSTIACIGAIFFQMVGGILADAYGWNYGFLTYLFPIWILAVTFLYLPEPEKKHKHVEVKGAKKVRLPKAVYWVALGQVLFSGLIFGYVVNISVVIQQDQLGSATQAGMAISVFTFGTLIAGTIFGRIKHALPNYYMPVGVLVTGLGMAFCFFSNSLGLIFLGSIIGGFGMGIGIPGIFAKMTDITPPAITSAAVGLVVVGQGLGGILGPFGFQVIINIFNQGIGRFPLIVSAVGLILLALVWALTVMAKPKQNVHVTLEQ